MTARPPIRFNPPPGVVKDDTTYAQGHRWVDTDKCRFHDGRPESIGGWEDMGVTAMVGKARGAHEWRLVAGNIYAAFGTHKKLYAFVTEDTLVDITPLRREISGVGGLFSTTLGSSTVNVEDSGHDATTGSIVDIQANAGGAVSIGGVTLQGEYEITHVDSDNYTIDAGSNATSTVVSGGVSTDLDYQINIGREFGTDDVTLGKLDARVWSLDNWGDLLIAAHNDNSSIWEWDPSVGGRATVMANAPTNVRGMFITAEFHIVALGAGGDPLTVAHSHQNNRTLWTAAIDNQAGEKRLQRGTRIVGGTSFRSGVNVIWTDTTTYAMAYDARSADFFSYPAITRTAGIIGPLAFAMSDSTIYWMGRKAFYRYDGLFRQMTPNEVDEFVFDAIAANQESLSHCWFNRRWHEVWFFYATGTDIDRYVILSTDGNWAPGAMERTCFTDQELFDSPLGVGTDGLIYRHEYGLTADGAALGPYCESGFGELREGLQATDVYEMIPDFLNLNGNVQITIKTKEAPQDPVVHQEGPFYCFSDTKVIDDMRVNGNLIAIRFAAPDVGSSFRMGKPRLIVEPGGER